MKNRISPSGICNPRALAGLALCSVGVFLAMLSFAGNPPGGITGPDANSRGSLGGKVNAAAASDWSIVSSPNTNAAQYNHLSSVVCTSPSDCWAVGFYQADGGNLQTL